MTISTTGHTGAAANTVTLPPHQAGDLIVISARRSGSDTPPSIPAAGGTVPLWENVLDGGASNLALRTCVALATASDHTSGTWTNAAHLLATVYRCSIGGYFVVAASSLNSESGTVWPALTLAGSRATLPTIAGYRVGAREASYLSPSYIVSSATANMSRWPLGLSVADGLIEAYTDDISIYEGNLAADAFAGSGIQRAHTLQIAANQSTLDEILDLVNPLSDAQATAVQLWLMRYGEAYVTAFARAKILAWSRGICAMTPTTDRETSIRASVNLIYPLIYGAGLETSPTISAGIRAIYDNAPLTNPVRVFGSVATLPHYPVPGAVGIPPSGWATLKTMLVNYGL